MDILLYHASGVFTPDDIGQYLKKFKLYEALGLIGKISCGFIDGLAPYRLERGVPLSDSVLAYIAMRLIEKSNDYRRHLMTIEDVLKVVDMCFGLPELIEKDQEAAEFLIRSSISQCVYNRPIQYLLPRTLLLYRDLWAKIPSAQDVDIQNAIYTVSKLTLDEILIFSLAFSGYAKNSKGFFRIYEVNKLKDDKVKQFFKIERQMTYMNWLSINYAQFREKSSSELAKIPNIKYERYRFNPLVKKPLIVPDFNPIPGQSRVYILPVYRSLFDRVTMGLYFDLSDYFMRSGKDNIFRTTFGIVFQEYIGVLLENATQRNFKVLREFKYGKPERATPDWIVLGGNRSVLIEVKQSGLYLEAKKWGRSVDVKKSLNQTIAEGVKQLASFESELGSKKHIDLNNLNNINEIERVVVTYDRTYFSNSILRDHVRNILLKDGISVNYHWHTISIEEFEYLLGLKGDLFELLKAKRIDPNSDKLDFQDYFAYMFPPAELKNDYLDNIWNEYSCKIDNTIS